MEDTTVIVVTLYYWYMEVIVVTVFCWCMEDTRIPCKKPQILAPFLIQKTQSFPLKKI